MSPVFALSLRSIANKVMVVAYCRSQGYLLTGVPSDALPVALVRGSQVD